MYYCDRAILRKYDCLKILLHHLRSPSLTVVSNACGALWNLSARCKEDQTVLRDLGAIPMLRSLVHSRHKMIAMGSSAALKNLDSAGLGSMVNSSASASSNSSLQARKQKALEQEIDQTLTEMCDNIDPISPMDDRAAASPFDRRMYRSLGGYNPSQFGKTSTSLNLLAPKGGLNCSRQMRSSSLERNSNRNCVSAEAGPVQPPVPARAVTTSSGAMSRLQVTRTAWRSHENEISYTSLNYEEDDQPVNYSLKYTEEVASGSGARWTPSRPTDAGASSSEMPSACKPEEAIHGGEKLDSSSVKKVLVLSAYRETDLDEPEHPTDFSLRYPEDEDYAAAIDTMQTYCMEGTPYETPFSRSSAASLTDLREAGFDVVSKTQDGGPQPMDKQVRLA